MAVLNYQRVNQTIDSWAWWMVILPTVDSITRRLGSMGFSPYSPVIFTNPLTVGGNPKIWVPQTIGSPIDNHQISPIWDDFGCAPILGSPQLQGQSPTIPHCAPGHCRGLRFCFRACNGARPWQAFPARVCGDLTHNNGTKPTILVEIYAGYYGINSQFNFGSFWDGFTSQIFSDQAIWLKIVETKKKNTDCWTLPIVWVHWQSTLDPHVHWGLCFLARDTSEFRCLISPFRQFPRSRHHFGQCPIHVGSSSIQFYHVIPLYPYTLGIQRFFD